VRVKMWRIVTFFTLLTAGLFVFHWEDSMATAQEATSTPTISAQNTAEDLTENGVVNSLDFLDNSETIAPVSTQPLVRVGLLDRFGQVDFRIKGKFSIVTENGTPIYQNVESDLRWRCKVEKSEPARFVYSVLVDSFASESDANALAETLHKLKHPARVLPVGREVEVGGTVIHKGQCWRVIVGAYDRENEARPLLTVLDENGLNLNPRVMRHRVSEPNGKIEFYDAEYDMSGFVDLGFRIVPEDTTTEITIYNIRVGVGFHWEHQEDRVYRGVIEVRIDNTGNLMVISEILLDDYLKGVIPSEMHHTYPLEALKAQTVAARSYTVAKLSTRPPNDPIDFLATVHFQVYSGITHENEATTRAVVETAGEVLKYGDRVCEAYFSSNSGGHTESKENWQSPGEPYLIGTPIMNEVNTKLFKYDLTKETDAALWIRSHPASYSNPRGTGINILDRNSKYFRWAVTYSRRELEDIIRRKLGFDIGTLVDILPLTRGTSGRITSIEILGSHRNHRIHGELNIRRILSESTLNSSCFIVDLVMGDLGDPVEVTLIGAGFGHGVGMDQTAAGVMAHEGMKYRDILMKSYKDTRIEKIW
jgi:SpoIID/LytB domain protein